MHDPASPSPGPERVEVWGSRHALGPDEIVRPTGLVLLYGRSVGQAALTVLLDNGGGGTSVAGILRRLRTRGVEVMGPRPHKRVADAMRWEIRRGRVIRVRRGVYRARPVPTTTHWRLWRRWTLRCWPEARWHPDHPLPTVEALPRFEPPEWWSGWAYEPAQTRLPGSSR